MLASQKEDGYKGDGDDGGKPLKNWCAIKEGRSAIMLDADPVPEGVVPALSPRHIPMSVFQLRQEINPQGTKEDKGKNKTMEIELNQRQNPKALQDLQKKLTHKLKINHELDESATPQNHNTRHNNPESEEVTEQHYLYRDEGGGERKGHETQNQRENEEEREDRVVEEREMIVNPETLGLPEGCEYMERGIFTSAVCSGPNITTVPDFPLSHQLESLHFYETGIQMVSDISGGFWRHFLLDFGANIVSILAPILIIV